MKLQEKKEAQLKIIFDRMMKGDKLTVKEIPNLSQVLQWFKKRQIKFSKADGYATRKIYHMDSTDMAMNKQLLKNK